MATVRDLIKGSLRLIGAIDPGEDVSSGEAADALSALNGMLQGWSIQNLLVYETVREVFTLIPSQSSYTMGDGGDFDTTRPVKIENAAVLSDQTEISLSILNEQQWIDLAQKDSSSNQPSKLYSMGTSPLETVKLWPVPTEARDLVIYSSKPLTQFANLNAQVELPDGYYPALRFNLALELAPEYGKQVDQLVAMKASEYLDNIKRINYKPILMTPDNEVTGEPNIFAGE